MSVKKISLIAGIIIVVIAVAIVAIIGQWLFTGPEGGVRLSNEMEEYALKYLASHGILEPSEELIAYYDATVPLNATEAAILTTKRVIYHKNKRSDSINLEDITNIRHRKEDVIGDILEISSKTGKSFKIEIAPFNQGETFKNVLMDAWEGIKNRQPNN